MSGTDKISKAPRRSKDDDSETSPESDTRQNDRVGQRIPKAKGEKLREKVKGVADKLWGKSESGSKIPQAGKERGVNEGEKSPVKQFFEDFARSTKSIKDDMKKVFRKESKDSEGQGGNGGNTA